jgi:hypothetical protein
MWQADGAPWTYEFRSVDVLKELSTSAKVAGQPASGGRCHVAVRTLVKPTYLADMNIRTSVWLMFF